MSLKIRLARSGAKKRPFYRIVLADSRSPRDGRFIERLGTYNPLLRPDDPSRVTLKEDRIRHWLHHGAQPTDRVARFLGAANLITAPAQRNNPFKARPKTKAQERAKEMESKTEAKETNTATESSEPQEDPDTTDAATSDSTSTPEEIETPDTDTPGDSAEIVDAATHTDPVETKSDSQD